MAGSLSGTWEQRWHPLRREWVIVSAHRNDRPWRGERVAKARSPVPAHADDCHLCPGNLRVSGVRNPDYRGVFVFDNDHPCVGADAPPAEEPASSLYQSRRADGIARVVCYSDRHDATLAELPLPDVVRLLEALQEQHRDLAARPEVRNVLMFENKGEVVGVSNPHPHCQIYATNFVFRTMQVEAEAAAQHHASHGRVLFQDVIAAEEADGRRVLVRADGALAFVPYFARYPYETYVAPRAAHPDIASLSAGELEDLAAALHETLVRMDNLWRTSFPYVMVLHEAPTKEPAPGFHFHIQIHPPLRRPGLLKYLAGPEIGGGNFLNDGAPEQKAAELRACPAVHYLREASPRTERPLVVARAGARSIEREHGAEVLLPAVLALHDRIRDAVVDAFESQDSGSLATVAHDADGDTAYQVDRVSEAVLVDGFAAIAVDEPVVLVAEGLPRGGLVLPPGAREEDCRWRVLVDPIDGTRGLMYQKRSGWVLTGVAPNRGAQTSLRDIVLAVQTEIPLLKQHLSDQVWAVRGAGVNAHRHDRITGRSAAIELSPSRATSLAHGFASLSRFFPGARDVLAAIDDEVMAAVVGAPTAGKALSFEDQYLSTGGQLYALLSGADRFIADLRSLLPPLLARRGWPRPLCVHPYDLCAVLIAEELGVIVTDGGGALLDAPFDIDADVSWVGYANAHLRALVEPALNAALVRHGMASPRVPLPQPPMPGDVALA